MAIRRELIDELLQDYKTPEDMLGENGLIKQLTKALIERAINAELTHHLGYERHSAEGKNSGNSRNGTSAKTLTTDHGELSVDLPRDRTGDFEPQLIRKGQRRFTGFDDKILSMYARGMTTRDIQAHLKDMYKVEVSPDLISTVTDEIMVEVREWQNRVLEEVYPIVYLDALWIKIRDEGHVASKAVYLAIGVCMDGTKDVLGIWIEKEEGAKFWLKVITELRNRGIRDILIACIDGLKGFPEAIAAVFPNTQIQLCIVHMVRNSMKFVSVRNRPLVLKDLKAIYQAPTEEQGCAALEALENRWQIAYPMIAKAWKANWTNLTTFFAYPPDIRRIIYTTNAIESLNNGLRKVTRNRGSFPSDDAAIKLLYLALQNIIKKWNVPNTNWPMIRSQFSIIFEDRVPGT